MGSAAVSEMPAYVLNCLFSLGTLLVHDSIRRVVLESNPGIVAELKGWVGAAGKRGVAWDRYVQRALGRFGQ